MSVKVRACTPFEIKEKGCWYAVLRKTASDRRPDSDSIKITVHGSLELSLTKPQTGIFLSTPSMTKPVRVIWEIVALLKT
jgi:hypothetical protein